MCRSETSRPLFRILQAHVITLIELLKNFTEDVDCSSDGNNSLLFDAAVGKESNGFRRT